METSFIENMQNKPEVELFNPTWKDLLYADRSFEIPFRITLTDHDSPLYGEKIIRVLPGKRMVIEALWGEISVIAKLFYEPGECKRHLLRETEGIQQLIDANIPSPRLLWQGSAQKNKIQILIFEKLTHGFTLQDIWTNRINTDELIPLMKSVTIELATQHVMGIVQRDLHFKNFFVTHKHIYTLDAGNIDTYPDILPREESLKHLGLFFAQLGIGTEAIQDQLLQTYAQSRGWLLKKSDIKYLSQSIAKWNVKRWERFKKKIYRNSSTFIRESNFTQLAIYDQNYYSKELAAHLKDPDLLFINNLLLKEGRSSTVAKININKRSWVIKRYNIKNFWHGLRRCLRSTRAAQSWQLSQELCLFGIPTAKPIAFIEKHFLGFRGKSYFIMEYIDGPHLGDFFADPSNQDSWGTVAEQVTQLFDHLTQLNLAQNDLKMTNILIHHLRPFLIDLDGMVEYRTQFGLQRAYRKALQRFMQNWEHRPKVKALFDRLIINKSVNLFKSNT